MITVKRNEACEDLVSVNVISIEDKARMLIIVYLQD
jgi:hypothetical protein